MASMPAPRARAGLAEAAWNRCGRKKSVTLSRFRASQLHVYFLIFHVICIAQARGWKAAPREAGSGIKAVQSAAF